MSGPRVGNGPGQGVTHQTEVASYGMHSPSAQRGIKIWGKAPRKLSCKDATKHPLRNTSFFYLKWLFFAIKICNDMIYLIR